MRLKLLFFLSMIICAGLFATISIVGETPDVGNMVCVYYHNDFVYGLAGHDLVVFDNSIPAVEVDRLTFEGYVRELFLSDDRAYVLAGPTIYIIDISRPSELRQTFELELPSYCYDIDFYDGYFYIAALEELTIIQIVDEDSLTIVGNIESIGTQCKSVLCSDHKMFMGRSEGGVSYYDLSSSPTSPSLRGMANTPGWVLDMEIRGDYVFVADGPRVGYSNSTVCAIDYTTPPSLAFTDTFYSEEGNCFEGVIYGYFYILADGDDGIKVLDISDPYGITQVDANTSLGTHNIQHVDYHDGYIYAASNGTLFILTSDIIVPEEDTEPPTAYLVEPIDGSYSRCLSQRIMFLIDDDNMVDTESITLTVDGYETMFTISGDTVIYAPMIEWMAGSHTYSIDEICDTAGNCADVSDLPSGTFNIDYSSPVITEYVPTDGSIVSIPNPLIRARTNDDGAGIDPYGLNFTVTIDGSATNYSYPDNISWDGMFAILVGIPAFTDADSVSITFRSCDDVAYCGPNCTEQTWSFIVSLGGDDTYPPSASVSYPIHESFSSVNTQQVAFSISDVSGVDESSLEIEVDGTSYTTESSRLTYEDDELLFRPAMPWGSGDHTVSLVSYADMVGNAGSSPVTTVFTMDFAVPYVSYTYPADGSSDIDSSSSIQITVIDAGSGLDAEALVLTINGTEVTAITTPIPGDSGFTLTYVPSIPYTGRTISVCLNNIRDIVDYGIPNIAENYCFSFSLESIEETKPSDIELVRAYPNPFNSSVRIELDNSVNKIDIFDVHGLLVHSANNIENSSITWSPENCESGIYLMRITSENEQKIERLIYMK